MWFLFIALWKHNSVLNRILTSSIRSVDDGELDVWTPGTKDRGGDPVGNDWIRNCPKCVNPLCWDCVYPRWFLIAQPQAYPAQVLRDTTVDKKKKLTNIFSRKFGSFKQNYVKKITEWHWDASEVIWRFHLKKYLPLHHKFSSWKKRNFHFFEMFL